MIFTEIAGHTREKEILEKALKSHRVAHAYLFSGPFGIGKRTLAVAFAMALNCSETEVGYCGLCRDCGAIESRNHENLIEVVPRDKDDVPSSSGIIRIDRIREVIKALHFTASAGRRVVILDDAHRLQHEAAHAMLKTLEEPPEGAVIILVTSMARSLLPTIVSRCQLLNFRPLTAGVIEEFLIKNNGLTPAEAATAARFSDGAISRAVTYSSSSALEKRIEVLQGLDSISRHGERRLLELAEKLSKDADLQEILEFMKIWCRDVAMSREGMDRLMVNIDLKDYIKAEAPLRSILETYALIEAARSAIAPPRYGNKRLALEVMLMGMMDTGALI
ncbi:MAG: DNA polymerase III subunit delta' [Thermodesulfobacteriota bacterium]